ncbi:hypothetical protein HYFRA_00006820 [Hymenoscyphus fraxineus]|uniref:Peptidase A1 domain-containing protein n=1 Tax=Hymenoscyphus fraxineus TaxID=746836 RepID=A0A9N9KQS0_9HELO|nr:hypothetical protein HYFRA_00006820 [Hymenoscyphus fraxineus]
MLSWNALSAFVIVNLLGLPNGVLAAALSSSLDSRAAAVPLVVPPTSKWDGIDGPWSSFTLSVGSPPQNMRVLASTASNQPWVVLPDGCPPTGVPECSDNRGGLFNPNATTSWYVPSWISNTRSDGRFSAVIGSSYGQVASLAYGYDNVSLSSSGNLPSLASQVVGGMTTKDFYMGMIGLSPLSTSFSQSSPPADSYLFALKAQGQIPSLTYGYTAGNQYRNGKPNPGSLTLGGSDTSLYIPNALSVNFNNLSAHDLTINVNKITFATGSGNKTLSNSPFSAFVDTTTPYLWLPTEVCKLFEEAFGLIWNEESQLYLVDAQLTKKIAEQNPTVAFTLTNSTSKVLVDIVLPFQAFDLIAKPPLVKTLTHYFPLKRAANAGQITLGRTFLQEAYIIADYERSTFSLHQRDWNAKSSNVTPIAPIGVLPPGTSTTNAPVNVGAIVAGCIGGVVLLAVIALAVVMGLRHRKRTRLQVEAAARQQSESSMRGFAQARPSPYPSTYLGSSLHNRSMHAKSIAPSSVWDRSSERPPRPDSPTSFYQSEYDPIETQTIAGLDAPMPYGTQSMRFSAVEFPKDYEPTIADRNSHTSSSQFGPPSPLFDAAAMPKPIVLAKTKEGEQTDFVCELPAREQVGTERLNFSKKPNWI